MNVLRDKFVAFRGSWGSGLAGLELEHDCLYSDNGPLARALDNLAQDLGQESIIRDHTVHSQPLEGVELVVWRDEMGLCLGGFTTYVRWQDAHYPELPLGEWADVAIK